MKNLKKKFYIFGAGISGLGAASILKDSSIVLEKNNEIGGLCRSRIIDGFTFDIGSHIFFTKNSKMIKYLDKILNSNYNLYDARIWSYYYGIFFPHPIQVHSFFLPEDLKIECLTSYFKNLITRGEDPKLNNYKDWCLYNFGEKFSHEFFLKYAKKYWTISPELLTVDWISNRILIPDIESILNGAFKRNTKNLHYITKFRYPKNGGFGCFIKNLSKTVPNVKLNQEVTSIDLENRFFIINNQKKIKYDTCISSIPLPEYLNICENLPKKIKICLNKLNWTSVLVIFLVLKNPIKTDKHFEYYYDEEIPFYRVSFPPNLSPFNVPSGKGSICIEIAYNGKQKIDKQELLENSVDSLKEIGYLQSSNEIILKPTENIKYAYAIFDFNRKDAVSEIIQYLRKFNIFPCGRYGRWDFLWSDQSFFDGINIAKEIFKN